MDFLLLADRLSKEYPTPQGPLRILSDVSLSLNRGDAVAIMGPSGSGKSTLLYILGVLEPPTSGTLTIGGRDPYQLSRRDQAVFRNEQIGFVFQDHCLLPQCSVLENVLTPTLVARASQVRARQKDGDYESRAREVLDAVGLSHRLNHRPAELSGGEKQRVAIARALILRPSLLLCDEPTGNLDRTSADSVASLLIELQKRHDMVLVIVTHSSELAARLPRRFELNDQHIDQRVD